MRVLIAEDDFVSQPLLKNLLQKWGYDVLEAATGDETRDLRRCRILERSRAVHHEPFGGGVQPRSLPWVSQEVLRHRTDAAVSSRSHHRLIGSLLTFKPLRQLSQLIRQPDDLIAYDVRSA